MVKKFHIPILAISEPKISLDAAGAICQYFHMQAFAGNGGEGSKIWLLWKDHLNITIHSTSPQHITALIR